MQDSNMPLRLIDFIITIVLLFTITAHTLIYAASLPTGSNSSTSTSGGPASSTNNQRNILNKQDNKDSVTESTEQKEPNPVLYDNYQQCYASLISDAVGRPAQEFDARKVTIKKYFKALSNAKYQKKFSDCFNANINSSNELDVIIEKCVLTNDKLFK